jgi:hypothetical protein
MSSVESDNEDCNCDVVAPEQAHCNVVHLIALNLGDTLSKPTCMADTCPSDMMMKKLATPIGTWQGIV